MSGGGARMNADTVEFLRMFPTPAPLLPYEKFVRQLPMPAVIAIVGYGELNDCTWDEIGAGLKQAVEFNRLTVHRCAGCYDWVQRADARPFSTLQTLDDGAKRFTFNVLCPKCDRRIEAGRLDDELLRNLHDYVFG